jgi:hypothetical protein
VVVLLKSTSNMRILLRVTLGLLLSATAAPLPAQYGNPEYWSTGPIRYAPCWRQPYYGYPYPCAQAAPCGPGGSAEAQGQPPAVPGYGQMGPPYPGLTVPQGPAWGGRYFSPFSYGYQ